MDEEQVESTEETPVAEPLNTEEKVEKLEDKVDDIKEDTRSINETLLNMNNN